MKVRPGALNAQNQSIEPILGSDAKLQDEVKKLREWEPGPLYLQLKLPYVPSALITAARST